MAKITLDPSRKVGPIKPMHAVGQGPMYGGSGKKMFKNFHYLEEAGIPYSRLHDVGGNFGAGLFVDVPNIFRNFDADELDPENYDFTFTDALITALEDSGVEPYYRLGVTIENYAEIKSFRLDPPKDYDKWARICEKIVAHYIDGWADGFDYRITYWEIWNEPDDGMRVSQMWNGTKEDYYRLYEVASKHLKSVFGDRIKVGGYAPIDVRPLKEPEKFLDNPRSQYFGEFMAGFFEHIKKTGAPLDFFSWHCYSEAQKTIPLAFWVREFLDKLGLVNTESHLNEWNPVHELRGTARHSAQITAMMLGMQKAPLDVLVLYDARLMGSSYAALFDPMTYTPFHGYYALVAFNHLYKLKTEIFSESDTEGLYAVAASDGKNSALVISNISDHSQPLEIEGADLSGARWHVIDQQRLLSWSPEVKTIEKNEVVLVEF